MRKKGNSERMRSGEMRGEGERGTRRNADKMRKERNTDTRRI